MCAGKREVRVAPSSISALFASSAVMNSTNAKFCSSLSQTDSTGFSPGLAVGMPRVVKPFQISCASSWLAFGTSVESCSGRPPEPAHNPR